MEKRRKGEEGDFGKITYCQLREELLINKEKFGGRGEGGGEKYGSGES